MKTYTLGKTDTPGLYRVVNLEGDWNHYYDEPSKIYLRAVNYILRSGYAKGPGFFNAALKSTPEEWEKKLTEAGDRGDAIHQIIKRALDGEKINRFSKVLAENNIDYRPLQNHEWEAILAWGAFWAAHDMALIVSERSVRNLKEGYAGTLDCLARVRKSCGSRSCVCKDFTGKIVALDWKSGSGIWPEYHSQNTSYVHAIESDSQNPFHGLKIEGEAVVRIGTQHQNGGYQAEWRDREGMKGAWARFLAARTIHDESYKPFDPEKEIYDIPEILDLEIQHDTPREIPEKDAPKTAGEMTLEEFNQATSSVKPKADPK